jgi:hypothetical protein
VSNLETRTKLVDYLESRFIGPFDLVEKGKSSTEILDRDPRLIFSAGRLHPTEEFLEEEKDEEDEPESVSTYSEGDRPSCMGIEVTVTSLHSIESVEVGYAHYERIKKNAKEIAASKGTGKYSWKRSPILERISGEKISSLLDGKIFCDFELSHGIGLLRFVFRENSGGEGRLKVFLVNDWHKTSKTGKLESIIYQPEIVLHSDKDGFLPIRGQNIENLGIEDRCMMVRHRRHRTFAQTYGCASSWDTDSESCQRVSTSFLPRHSIRGLSFTTKGPEDTLSLAFAGFGLISENENENRQVIESFEAFVADYRNWIDLLTANNSDLDSASEEVKLTIEECKRAAKRMDRGIELLESDAILRKAFGLANVAMLMQATSKNGKYPKFPEDNLIEFYRGAETSAKWRPFQLAFLLLCIETTSDPESEYRQGVDLIWFPTGGGKTEAYLGLSAFAIMLERLRNPDATHGTMIFSRYTLRLLTAQQFERTSAMICALEALRRESPEALGHTPISLGLWLGKATLPNTIEQAEERMEELLESDSPRENNPFFLNECPFCRHPLLPDRKSEIENECGFSVDAEGLSIRCRNSECLFHEQSLPLHLVDDQIYRTLPTFVIGTIDKFASLPWKTEPGQMLTGRNGAATSPSLIIQDELHLISGPLGTLSGVYECAIDALCSQYGSKPHLVASTATVRRAQEQCSALYGRKVHQFPPPGLDEADSYFAKRDDYSPGRLYLGIMGTDRSITKTTNRLHAILLQGVASVSPNDAYWTLVSFFNNKRNMGTTTTAASDDIPTWFDKLEPTEKEKLRNLKDDEVEDLHSDKGSSAEITAIFRRLLSKREESDALSLLLCTNIISVGVDVDRLGLMLVNGQPQSTSEYIQVTSRVGRTPEMPGLVVSLHHSNKPRDRSRFESFLPFHSRLYANVEPTSVTPFSKPSRDRALHALMTTLARNLPGGLPENDAADQIGTKPELERKVTEIIETWLRASSPDERNRTLNDLSYLFDSWRAWGESEALRYSSSVRALTSLLHRKVDPSSIEKGWFTMDSMRNVDSETYVKTAWPRDKEKET